jgi:hypothetical protein
MVSLCMIILTLKVISAYLVSQSRGMMRCVSLGHFPSNADSLEDVLTIQEYLIDFLQMTTTGLRKEEIYPYL